MQFHTTVTPSPYLNISITEAECRYLESALGLLLAIYAFSPLARILSETPAKSTLARVLAEPAKAKPPTECTIISTWFRLMQRVRIGANDNGPLKTLTVVRPVTFKAEEKLSSALWLKPCKNSNEMPACCKRGVEPAPRPGYLEYPQVLISLAGSRATHIAWEIERRAAKQVCGVPQHRPIESTMDKLEACGLLHGKHNGVAWEMGPAHEKRVDAMPYEKALRYAKAHRRWITEKAMSTNGDFRSFKEILAESRIFPN